MEPLNLLSSSLNRLRASANSYLSDYEPLALIAAPILTLILARLFQSFVDVISEKGLKATLLGFFMSCVK